MSPAKGASKKQRMVLAGFMTSIVVLVAVVLITHSQVNLPWAGNAPEPEPEGGMHASTQSNAAGGVEGELPGVVRAHANATLFVNLSYVAPGDVFDGRAQLVAEVLGVTLMPPTGRSNIANGINSGVFYPQKEGSGASVVEISKESGKGRPTVAFFSSPLNITQIQERGPDAREWQIQSFSVMDLTYTKGGRIAFAPPLDAKTVGAYTGSLEQMQNTHFLGLEDFIWHESSINVATGSFNITPVEQWWPYRWVDDASGAEQFALSLTSKLAFPDVHAIVRNPSEATS